MPTLVQAAANDRSPPLVFFAAVAILRKRLLRLARRIHTLPRMGDLRRSFVERQLSLLEDRCHFLTPSRSSKTRA
jgi:hypothetical protein